MRQFSVDQQPWILNLRMRNAEQCVNHITKYLKDEGFKMGKVFEKSRKIVESEVTSAAYDGFEVDKLEASIQEQYTKWQADRSPEVTDHMMALYNKAIEYYGAKNNMEKSAFYLTRLKQLFEEPPQPAPQQSAEPAGTPQGPSEQDQQ